MSLNESEFPKLYFVSGNNISEIELGEASYKGCIGLIIELEDGKKYRVSFYDCGRLESDLHEEISCGRMCVADVGLIILPEVTLENIMLALRQLIGEGYFENFHPIS
jgi:hypothetical protein